MDLPVFGISKRLASNLVISLFLLELKQAGETEINYLRFSNK